MRRFLVERDGTCRFVGCNRPAKSCDIDHSLTWNDCGCTNHDNLAHLCPNHHAVKHDGKWKVLHDPDRPGVLLWTSPIGYEFSTEPRMKVGGRRRKTRSVGNTRAQAERAEGDTEAAPF